MIVKEKARVLMYDKEGKLSGGTDFETGGFVGVRGNAIKAPSAKLLASLKDYRTDDPIQRLYRDFLHTATRKVEGERNRKSPSVEKFLSLGILYQFREDIERRIRPYHFKKDFINYLRERGEGHITYSILNSYELKRIIGNEYPSIFRNDYVCERLIKFKEREREQGENINEFLRYCARVYELQSLEYLGGININRRYYDLGELFCLYYNLTARLELELFHKGSFLGELMKRAALAEINKEALLTKSLKSWNGDERLLFEDDEYKVVLLLTPQDFREEGKANSNCVGGYIDKVGNRRDSRIVSVREKEGEERITCEIGLRGEILSYLGYRNKRVEHPFREKYQEHLYKMFG